MKQPVDEATSWWNNQLMKQLVHETTSWWNNHFMKHAVVESTIWWNNMSMKQLVDEATSWWNMSPVDPFQPCPIFVGQGRPGDIILVKGVYYDFDRTFWLLVKLSKLFFSPMMPTSSAQSIGCGPGLIFTKLPPFSLWLFSR
jgi:hypothetical protein